MNELLAQPEADLPRLSHALSSKPSNRDTAALVGLAAADLSADERIDLLTLLEEQKRWIEAAQLRVLAVMAAADPSPHSLVQDAVSVALQVPVRTAQRKLAEASTLARDLPRTLAALADGSLSAEHARVVAEAWWRLPNEPMLAPALEQAVVPPIVDDHGIYTVSQYRALVRRAAMALAPTTAEERHRRAQADRSVRLMPDDDGMAWLSAYLPAPEAQLLHTRLTAAATLLPPHDARTIDQQRADLFVDAVLSGLPAEALPRLQGRKPAINVVVSADTLLGADEQPGHLTGYGPITAEQARRLAADRSGTWRRLLTDPDTGALLDLSADRYRPPQRLRDFLAARDDVCAFPTCNQPGYRCEYEHIDPFSEGGRTTRGNGALACRRHNQAKHGTGWRYRHNRDGTFTWITDTGHRYRSGSTAWTRTPRSVEHGHGGRSADEPAAEMSGIEVPRPEQVELPAAAPPF